MKKYSPAIKTALYFIAILFLEATCGFGLGILYTLFSNLLLTRLDLASTKLSELINYLVILIPPTAYCLYEYKHKKAEKARSYQSSPYLWAAIVYLIFGCVFLLLLTDFYLLR